MLRILDLRFIVFRISIFSVFGLQKKSIQLVKVIGIGILALFALNSITAIFSVDEEKVESEIKSEYAENYIEDVKSLKNSLTSLESKLVTLTKLIEKQKVDKTIYNYVNYVVPTEEDILKFSNTAKTSYWYVHYEDLSKQGYMVIELEGSEFNFDKVMKMHREDGSAEQYGGLTNIRQITYNEFMSAKPNRRIELK